MISGLLEKSRELDNLRQKQEDVLLDINRIHKKLQTAPEMVEKSGDVLHKLQKLYVHAKELSLTEVSVSQELLFQLDAFLQSGISAAQRKKIEVSEQKKKRFKSDVDIPRFPPAASMRSQLEQLASLKGEQVAARVTNDDAEKDEWFVVKVIHFDKDAKDAAVELFKYDVMMENEHGFKVCRFEMLDEEPGDDEESVQRKYKLSMARIIPFPKKGEPSSAPEYPPGMHVLAVYPGTTALYIATIANHCKRKVDDYVHEFDDDEEEGSANLPQRNVPFNKVLPLPEGHRQ